MQKSNSTKTLTISDRLLLAGQFLTIFGSAMLSLGQIFKLMSEEEIPTHPITVSEKNKSNNTNTEKTISYFD